MSARTGSPPRLERVSRVIEAGAGTGKTTAIVCHVLDLLLYDPDADPERIVLTTFTEKAAAEIADRIREALTDIDATIDGDPRWPADRDLPAYRVKPEDVEKARAACARHLAQIDRLRSQTIHSFCQSLLRLYPIEAGLPAQFRIIEGYERNRVHDEIWSEWLDAELSDTTEPSRLTEWKLLYRQFAKLDEIRDAIFELVPRAELLRDETLSLGEVSVVTARLRELVAEACELRPGEVDKVPEAALDAARWLREHTPPASEELDEWIEWSAGLERQADSLRFDSGARKYPGRAALQELRGNDESPSPFVLLRSHRVAMALRAVAIRFAAHLEGAKEELGAVDFDDLLTLAASLLDDPRILAEIRARYDHLFVDEFQDTDRVQAKIVDLLARDEAEQLVPGRVTVVGDPKQSIYAFRSADPETYRAKVEKFVDDGALWEMLAGQYRSTPRLVEAVNAMFSVLLAAKPRDANVVHPAYHALTAMKKDDGCTAPAVRILLAHDSQHGATADEAAAVAEWIAREQAARPGELKRFAILLRKNRPIVAFADALAARGIASVTPSAGSLLEQPVVVDLMAVLRAVAHPFDFAARVSAARSSLFALTDDEIAMHLAACERSCACIWDGFGARIAAWGELARRAPVSEVVELVLSETGVESTASLLRDASVRQSHLDRVREIAASYDRMNGGSLAQFVDDLAVRREEEAESEPNLADHDSDAVRIMTVHGAKGLEFDTVILPDLASSGGGVKRALFATAEPRRLVMSRGVRSVSSEEPRLGHQGETLGDVLKAREEGEDDRLFYVAVTRAASRVVFVTHPAKRSQYKTEFLKRLRPCLGIAKDGFLDHWPESPGETVEELTVGTATIPVAFERCPEPAEANTPSRVANGAAKAIVEMNQDPREIAAALRESLHESGATRATANAATIDKRLAAARYRDRGTALHRALERWDGEESTLAPLVDALRIESALSPGDAAVVRERVAALRHSSAWRQIAEMETLGREVVIHAAKGEGATEELRIDRLLRDASGLVVLDYKSGQPDEERLARDAAQVRGYCAALSQASESPCRGLIWYIGADRDELVDA